MDAFEKKIIEIIRSTVPRVRPSAFVKENYAVIRDWKLAGRTFLEIAKVLSEHGIYISGDDLSKYMRRNRHIDINVLDVHKRKQRAATAAVGRFIREHEKAGYSVPMLLAGFEDWKKRLSE